MVENLRLRVALCTKLLVNFIMNSNHDYTDPLLKIFKDFCGIVKFPFYNETYHVYSVKVQIEDVAIETRLKIDISACLF